MKNLVRFLITCVLLFNLTGSVLSKVMSVDCRSLQALKTCQKYFKILSVVGHSELFGTISGEEDYRPAYELLSYRYKDILSFSSHQFFESFKEVASLELLKIALIPGKEEDDYRQVFVEIKTLEAIPHPGPLSSSDFTAISAFVYYSGLVTLVEEEDGWKIDRVEFEPENFISQLGGHSPWRYDPQSVAEVAADKELSEIGITETDTGTYPCTFESTDDDLTKVSFTSNKGTVSVYLACLSNGEFIFLCSRLTK